MRGMEACVSHDYKNFWNEEADQESTELDEDDFDMEERIFEELINFLITLLIHCFCFAALQHVVFG